MIRPGCWTFLAGFLMLFTASQGLCEDTRTAAPDFKEVYDLVRAHLAGITETDLNHTAVKALVSALGPKVSLVDEAGAAVGTGTVAVSKSALFEGKIGYLRINRVKDGLDRAIREGYEK